MVHAGDTGLKRTETITATTARREDISRKEIKFPDIRYAAEPHFLKIPKTCPVPARNDCLTVFKDQQLVFLLGVKERRKICAVFQHIFPFSGFVPDSARICQSMLNRVRFLTGPVCRCRGKTGVPDLPTLPHRAPHGFLGCSSFLSLAALIIRG